MRILIVEDNAFNAFCLSRLLESVVAAASIDCVNNSQEALSFIDANLPDLVIIDGELNIIDGGATHGPQLAAVILKKYPHLPLVAWSDSEYMREGFSKIFTQHNRLVNEYNTWEKNVNSLSIKTTCAYYFDNVAQTNHQAFSHANGAQKSNGFY